MATENVLPCHTFHFVDDDFYSIKKYIESVFDDGDLSEAESGSKSSNDEFCIDMVEPESIDADLLNKSGGKSSLAIEDADAIKFASKELESNSAETSKPEDGTQATLLKNDKMKFSFKISNPTLLNRAHLSLEEPRSLQTKTSEDLVGPKTLPANDSNSNLPTGMLPVTRADVERSQNSDHNSLGRASTSSSSSSRRISKSRERDRGRRSRSRSRRRRHRSPKRSSDKHRGRHRQDSRRRKRHPEDDDCKTRRAISSGMKHPRSSSSDGERIIAAQLFLDRGQEGRRKRPYTRDKESDRMAREKGRDERDTKESEESCVAKFRPESGRSEKSDLRSVDKKFVNSSDQEKEKKSENSGRRGSRSSSRSGSAAPYENIPLNDHGEPLLDKEVSLRINNITTDENLVMVRGDEAREFRKRKASVESDLTGEGKRRLLERAILSLETSEDIGLCCRLLLDRIGRMSTERAPTVRSKSDDFVDGLRSWLESETIGREGRVENEDTSKRDSNSEAFQRIPNEASPPEPPENERSVRDLYSDGKHLQRPTVPKRCKRVSIVSPAYNSSESEIDSGDLQVIEQQIRAVLNPAVLGGSITKVEYKEIVGSVVNEIMQWHDRISEFDCVSFLHESLKSIKEKEIAMTQSFLA